jgi:hypothetical protein
MLAMQAEAGGSHAFHAVALKCLPRVILSCPTGMLASSSHQAGVVQDIPLEGSDDKEDAEEENLF